MNKTIKLAIFTLILTLTANIAFAQTPTTADGWLRLGKQQAKLKNYNQAINSFSNCIRLDVTKNCYLERGVVFAQTGDHQSAVEDYTKGIQVSPQSPLLFKLRGTSYFNLKSYREAVTDLTKTIQLKPDDHTYAIRGFSNFYLKNFDAAVADMFQALRLNPRNLTAYLVRGEIYLQQKKYNEAIADFSAVLKITPHPETYDKRGKSYTAICRIDQAISDLDKAIELSPNEAIYYLDRARAWVYKDLDKAQNDADKASELSKGKPGAVGIAAGVSGIVSSIYLRKKYPSSNSDCQLQSGVTNQNSGNSNQPVKTQPNKNSRQPTEAELKTSNDKGKAFAGNLDRLIQGKSKEEANKIIRLKVGELMKTDFYAGYTALILVKIDDYQKRENFNSFDKDTRIAMVKIQKFDSANWQFINQGKPKPLYPNDVPLPGTSWNSNTANNSN